MLQATVCAKFGLPCIIYMGAKDMERQALNVFRMRLLGAEVRRTASQETCSVNRTVPSPLPSLLWGSLTSASLLLGVTSIRCPSSGGCLRRCGQCTQEQLR